MTNNGIQSSRNFSLLPIYIFFLFIVKSFLFVEGHKKKEKDLEEKLIFHMYEHA